MKRASFLVLATLAFVACGGGGEAPPPQLAALDLSLDFGTIRADANSTRLVSVENALETAAVVEL